MKKITALLKLVSGFIVLFVLSCGINAEEQNLREKAIADSSARATEQAVKYKMQFNRALEDSITANLSAKDMLQFQLNTALAELETSKDQMTRIKEWQLGRTPQERDNQIRNQTHNILSLEQNIAEIQSLIAEKEVKILNFKRQIKLNQ